MSVIESPPAKRLLAICWLAFATLNVWLMLVFVGNETIPYHLIWASYALLYGLVPWSRMATVVSFAAVSLATGVLLILHAEAGAIGWAECSEIILMGVIVGLLIWHVNRHRAAQRRIAELRERERVRANSRELAARFGSHEVRTRLTVARGFAELIRDATTDSTIRSDASVVLGELDKASALATMLLTLVRVETPSPTVAVHLDELVRTVVTRWSATADRDWESSSAVGFMMGDAERLEAALDCLIENAVKFTGAGDVIRVDARLDGADVLLSVADTGAGIPQADLERVLQVFETGSTAGERAGSGLGLAIVNAIVTARSGSLEVSSTVGAGSCFTMRMAAGGSPHTAMPPLNHAASSVQLSRDDALKVG